MLKEVIEAHPDATLSVHIVWLPMVPGDSEEAARKTAAMFTDARVRQYYDANRMTGLACTREAFPSCLKDALANMPHDHPMRKMLVEWLETGSGDGPMWDAVLFYPKGVEWTERMPAPVTWSKQVGFFGADAGDVTGTFFRNDCRKPPVDSDWHVQVRQAMAQLLADDVNKKP